MSNKLVWPIIIVSYIFAVAIFWDNLLLFTKKNGFLITFYTIVPLRKLEYADMFRPFLKCSMCFSDSI